ncbi:MAG: lipoprotein signal peptidase [Muribaculaceae bacterium]|nr:lipoprotein signal peptidase [Muribaculaceae bacterium]
MKNSKAWLAAAIVLLVIIIDQLIKVWVKTRMYWGEDIEILSWFHIRFVQNNGMAFGMEFGSKLFLTLFRIVAVGVLIWIICRLCKRGYYPKGFVACVALITAGAAGNIFDCVFYGEIFTNPYPPQIAQFVPWGEGYAPIFHGLVVDMFYFPLFSFQWPDWLPFLGGKTFSFFDPVFNFADAAISVGMAILIIFYSKYLGGAPKEDIVEADNSAEK